MAAVQNRLKPNEQLMNNAVAMVKKRIAKRNRPAATSSVTHRVYVNAIVESARK